MPAECAPVDQSRRVLPAAGELSDTVPIMWPGICKVCLAARWTALAVARRSSLPVALSSIHRSRHRLLFAASGVFAVFSRHGVVAARGVAALGLSALPVALLSDADQKNRSGILSRIGSSAPLEISSKSLLFRRVAGQGLGPGPERTWISPSTLRFRVSVCRKSGLVCVMVCSRCIFLRRTQSLDRANARDTSFAVLRAPGLIFRSTCWSTAR